MNITIAITAWELHCYSIVETGIRVAVAKTLTTDFQVILQVPGGASGPFRVRLIHVVNLTPADATVRICQVPSTNPLTHPVSQNALLWDRVIEANDFLAFDDHDLMPAGWSIQASASANDTINIRVVGIQE